MYDIQFVATSSAGWQQAIALIDAETDAPLDLGGAAVELEVRSRCGGRVLHATTDDRTLERPRADVIQWRFLPSETSRLRNEETYNVGCIVTTAGGTMQLFTGTLALIDGEVR